jgi:hypothetical protein
VAEYKNAVRLSLNDCTARFQSSLVDVRNEALRATVLESERMKSAMYDNVPLVMGILGSAADNLTHVRGLDREMGRCLATIAANLCCDKPEELMKDEDNARLFMLRRWVRESVVPTLLKFWEKPHTAKCHVRDRETDKQIVRLLGILYADADNKHIDKDLRSKIQARLETMDDTPQYKKMRAQLEKVVDAVKQEQEHQQGQEQEHQQGQEEQEDEEEVDLPIPSLPTRSDSHVWYPFPTHYAEEIIANAKAEAGADWKGVWVTGIDGARVYGLAKEKEEELELEEKKE